MLQICLNAQWKLEAFHITEKLNMHGQQTKQAERKKLIIYNNLLGPGQL